jgi:hypothetical protein
MERGSNSPKNVTIILEAEVGKTDDIKSVNNIFGNPCYSMKRGWEGGLVHEM